MGAISSPDHFRDQRVSIIQFLRGGSDGSEYEQVCAEVAASAEACKQVELQPDEARERFWNVVQEIRERNADKDPDEVLREVTEVVEEVCQEHYERARRAQGSH